MLSARVVFPSTEDITGDARRATALVTHPCPGVVEAVYSRRAVLEARMADYNGGRHFQVTRVVDPALRRPGVKLDLAFAGANGDTDYLEEMGVPEERISSIVRCGTLQNTKVLSGGSVEETVALTANRLVAAGVVESGSDMNAIVDKAIAEKSEVLQSASAANEEMLDACLEILQNKLRTCRFVKAAVLTKLLQGEEPESDAEKVAALGLEDKDSKYSPSAPLDFFTAEGVHSLFIPFFVDGKAQLVHVDRRSKSITHYDPTGKKKPTSEETKRCLSRLLFHFVVGACVTLPEDNKVFASKFPTLKRISQDVRGQTLNFFSYYALRTIARDAFIANMLWDYKWVTGNYDPQAASVEDSGFVTIFTADLLARGEMEFEARSTVDSIKGDTFFNSDPDFVPPCVARYRSDFMRKWCALLLVTNGDSYI